MLKHENKFFYLTALFLMLTQVSLKAKEIFPPENLRASQAQHIPMDQFEKSAGEKPKSNCEIESGSTLSSFTLKGFLLPAAAHSKVPGQFFIFAHDVKWRCCT